MHRHIHQHNAKRDFGIAAAAFEFDISAPSQLKSMDNASTSHHFAGMQ